MTLAHLRAEIVIAYTREREAMAALQAWHGSGDTYRYLWDRWESCEAILRELEASLTRRLNPIRGLPEEFR